MFIVNCITHKFTKVYKMSKSCLTKKNPVFFLFNFVAGFKLNREPNFRYFIYELPHAYLLCPSLSDICLKKSEP